MKAQAGGIVRVVNLGGGVALRELLRLWPRVLVPVMLVEEVVMLECLHHNGVVLQLAVLLPTQAEELHVSLVAGVAQVHGGVAPGRRLHGHRVGGEDAQADEGQEDARCADADGGQVKVVGTVQSVTGVVSHPQVIQQEGQHTKYRIEDGGCQAEKSIIRHLTENI